MKKPKYIALSKSTIQAEQALLFPIYNRKGRLVAEKDEILTKAQLKKILELAEIFTPMEALKPVISLDEGHDLNGAIDKFMRPHQRLKNIEKILQSVCEYPSDSSAPSKIFKSISRLQSICNKTPSAAIAKIITDSNENYAVRHALHTAILCELAAIQLKWPIEKRHDLVGAAFTMNLSLGFMQDELLDQERPLSQEQKLIIHNHPLDSIKILQDIGIQNTDWLDYVEKHHEAADGTGYPKGCHQNNIPLGAMLISLSDVYCAKVSGRNYREAIYANVATRDIFLEKDNSNKDTLIDVFVKTLGLYPPGCFVRLKNKEFGIVVKRGKHIKAPLIRLVSENVNDPIISNTFRQVDDKEYAIQEIVPIDANKFKINYNVVWDY